MTLLFDSFWRAISVKENLEKVRVPVFAIGGWYDNFVQSDLEAYAAGKPVPLFPTARNAINLPCSPESH